MELRTAQRAGHRSSAAWPSPGSRPRRLSTPTSSPGSTRPDPHWPCNCSTRTKIRSTRQTSRPPRSRSRSRSKTNPGAATLSGTTTVNSSDGAADFGNLQINNAGVGYELAANATGFTGVTSAAFTITGQIRACGTGSCTASQSTPTTAASVATSSPGNFVTLGLGGVSFSCNHYNAVSDVAAFDVVNSSGTSITGSSSIATLTVSPSAVEISTPSALFLAALLRVANAVPGDPGHQRNHCHRRRHLPHRTAAALLPD